MAEKKIFLQEYTYQVSEDDSEATSRANALEQVKILLLEEASVFFRNEIDWTKGETLIDGTYINKDIYEQNIKSIISGITEINIIYEFWNTKIYLLKGTIRLDTDDIAEKIKQIIDKKQQLGELGEIRKNGNDSESDKSVIAMPPEKNGNDSKSAKSDTSTLPNVIFVAYDIPPRPIIPITPIYPEKAKKSGMEGTIYIQYFIDKTGNVTEAWVIKGIPNSGLDESALEAVRNSSWEPALQGGMKVGIWQTVPVKFEL